ncbi:MAG: DUF2225 domain-containing protein [Candidatus Hodarchaeota archaeon]
MESIWTWRPSSPKITLEKLFHPKYKFCFLVGSGISLDPPSCLPTGYQFTKALLTHLVPKEEIEDILVLTNPNREGMRDPGDFLRFEELMEYIKSDFDSELKILDGYAECTNPNFNHLFLAFMCIQGHHVFTTNFDNLIEHALLKVNIPQKDIVPLIYQTDWEEWQSQKNRKQQIVFKLHGSLIDIRSGQNSRDSIQATLQQIVKGKQTEIFQLESWKRKILQLLVKENDLIVIGYSGLDDFDVLPTLWSMPSSKRIFWITHDKNLSPDQARIEIVAKKTSEASDVSSLDRVGQNILNFAQSKTRRPQQLFRIHVHTGQLLGWLWNQYDPQHPFKLDSRPCPKEEFVLPETYSLSEARKRFFAGRIYEDRGQRQKGFMAYIAALEEIKSKIENKVPLSRDDHLIRREGAVKLGNLLHDEGSYDGALGFYKTAIQIAMEMEDYPAAANQLSNYGRTLMDLGRHDKALEVFQQTLGLAEQWGYESLKGHCQREIALCLTKQERYEEARKFMEQGIQIAKHLGEYRGSASALTNLGIILCDSERYEEAQQNLELALEITEKIGDTRKKSNRLMNLANIFVHQSKLNEAEKTFQEAIEIAEEFENMREKAMCLYNIGWIYVKRGKIKEASGFMEQARQIAEQADAPDLEEQITNGMRNLLQLILDSRSGDS